MDKFLETWIIKTGQEEIENLSRSITSNEIYSVIKNHETKKSPGLNGFTGKFYQTFKEELTPTFLNQS